MMNAIFYKDLLKKYKIPIFLIGIFLVGLFLRAFKLNVVYITSDDAIGPFEAIRICNRYLFSTDVSNNFFSGIIGFPYGLSIVFHVIVISILQLFHLPITEFALRLPLIIFGSLTSVGVYLFIKQLTQKEYPALFLSSFIAFSCFHVLLSRFNMMSAIVIVFCFSLFGIYFLIKYFKTNRNYFAWLASFFFGFYIVSSLLYPAIIPLIIFVSFIYTNRDKQSFIIRLKESIKRLFKKELIVLPLIFFGSYLLAFMYAFFVRHELTMGFLGRIFSKRGMVKIGFYLPEFMDYMINNYGDWFYFVFIFGIIYGFYCLKKLKTQSILFFWFLVYCAPFILFSGGEQWYLLEGIIPLILFAWLGIFELAGLLTNKYHMLKSYFKLSLFLVLIASFIISVGVILNQPNFKGFLPQATARVFGSVYEGIGDTGVKAAGYFVRKNVLSEQNIFTDLEPVLANLYFNRYILYAQYDATLPQNLEYFEKIQDKVGVIVVNAKDSKLYLEKLKSNVRFFKAAEIICGGRHLIDVYTRDEVKADIIETAKANNLFDREFGWMGKILSRDMKYPQAQAPL